MRGRRRRRPRSVHSETTRTVLSFENVKVAEAEALRTAAGNMCGTVLRGLRRSPVRAVKDRVGTWETSCRPQSPRRSRATTGSPMDDAAGEGMRRPHSTDEASNNTGRQAGGGECGGKGRSSAPTCSCRPAPRPWTALCGKRSENGTRPWPQMTPPCQPPQPEHPTEFYALFWKMEAG